MPAFDFERLDENHRSFLDRVRWKVSLQELKMIDFAYDLAKYGHGHKNQMRESGERYFEHCRATALILIDEFRIFNAEIIEAGLLHDILEDSFLLTYDRIELVFGVRVARIVESLTKHPDKPAAQYVEQIKGEANYSGLGVLYVKLADRLHNLRTLGACSPEKQRRKIEETKTFYLPLVGRLDQSSSGLEERVGKLFAQALDNLDLTGF